MKLTEKDQTLLEPITIGAPTDPRGRLIGSHPITNLKPKDNGDGFPDPDNPPPPPPPPAVSAPDIALQFRPCLEDIPTEPGFDLEGAVISAIKDSVGGSADVRYECGNETGKIGIWLRPSGSEAANQARQRGLDHVNILQPSGENFAVFVNASYIRGAANDAWDQAPKRLNGDGNPDTGGPIHLTGFEVDFQGPDKIITRIKGFDERPWPDVSFTLNITDTFSVSGADVRVDSKTDLDADTGWIDFLTGLATFLGAVINPLFFIAAAGFLTERIIIGSADPGQQSGAGAAAAQQIPKEIYVQGGFKLVCQYSRVNVSTGGVSAGGTVLFVPRIPTVSISGPTQIAVTDGATTVSKTYAIHTDDMRGGLSITWTGDGFPVHKHDNPTSARFGVGNIVPGQSRLEHIQVNVTDVDGLSAQATLGVSIHMTSAEDNIPPVCRVKPWLPQCQNV